jgi:Cu/Ag efflux protein CusF
MNRLPKWLTLVLAMTLVLGLALPALAADEQGRGTIQTIAPDHKAFRLIDLNGKEWTFLFADNAKVRINDKEAPASALKPGEKVELTFYKSGNSYYAKEVRAKTSAAQAGEEGRGRVKSISPDHKSFVLTDLNGKEWTFLVSKDLKVRVNGKESQFNDLKVGDDIVLNFIGQGKEHVAQVIQANRGVTDKVREGVTKKPQAGEGKVKEVMPKQNAFTLTDLNGKVWMFHLANDARVRLNNNDSNLNQLKPGDNVNVTFDQQKGDNMAHEINAVRK